MDETESPHGPERSYFKGTADATCCLKRFLWDSKKLTRCGFFRGIARSMNQDSQQLAPESRSPRGPRQPHRLRGPMSIIQSAHRKTSTLCSITTIEFPRSISRLIATISNRISSKCNPVVGSSSTYSCPVELDFDNSVASFTR